MLDRTSRKLCGWSRGLRLTRPSGYRVRRTGNGTDRFPECIVDVTTLGLLGARLGGQGRRWRRYPNRHAIRGTVHFHGHLRYPAQRPKGRTLDLPPGIQFIASHERGGLACEERIGNVVGGARSVTTVGVLEGESHWVATGVGVEADDQGWGKGDDADLGRGRSPRAGLALRNVSQGWGEGDDAIYQGRREGDDAHLPGLASVAAPTRVGVNVNRLGRFGSRAGECTGWREQQDDHQQKNNLP